VEGAGRFRLYGTTIDDAAGEAFDKTAKLIGLSYPGGPRLEALAKDGNPKRYRLPRPMLGREGADFSFSGLKTAVRLLTMEEKIEPADLAASFQAAVIDILRDRTENALVLFRRDFPNAESPAFVLGGGVAANNAIRAALGTLAAEEGFTFKVPPIHLCTDNGAMIAWAGIERAALGQFDPLDAPARARWPLVARDAA
jgi:N6-L-threonylcarbamoyladenine synthase